MVYRISAMPVVEERYFSKHPHSIKVYSAWKAGYVDVKDPPDLSDYDPDDGAEYSTFGEYIGEGLHNHRGDDFEFSETLTQAEIEELENFISEFGELALEERGWTYDYCEVFFYGVLAIEEIWEN